MINTTTASTQYLSPYILKYILNILLNDKYETKNIIKMILVNKYWQSILIPSLSFKYYSILNEKDLNLFRSIKNRYENKFEFKDVELGKKAIQLFSTTIATTTSPSIESVISKIQTSNILDLVNRFRNIKSLILWVNDNSDINGTLATLKLNISRLKKLEKLDIRFGGLPSSVWDLRSTVSELPHLRSLKCTYIKDLTPMSSAILPMNFNNKSLKKLFLKKIKINLKNIQAIICKNRVLTHISISNLLEGDIDTIIESLTNTNRTIEKVYLELISTHSIDAISVRNLLLKNKILKSFSLIAKLNPIQHQIEEQQPQQQHDSNNINYTLKELSIYNFEMLKLKFNNLSSLSINSSIDQNSVIYLKTSLQSLLKSLSLFYQQTESTDPLIDFLSTQYFLEVLILKGSQTPWKSIISNIQNKKLSLNYLNGDKCINPFTNRPCKEVLEHFQHH